MEKFQFDLQQKDLLCDWNTRLSGSRRRWRSLANSSVCPHLTSRCCPFFYFPSRSLWSMWGGCRVADLWPRQGSFRPGRSLQEGGDLFRRATDTQVRGAEVQRSSRGFSWGCLLAFVNKGVSLSLLQKNIYHAAKAAAQLFSHWLKYQYYYKLINK